MKRKIGIIGCGMVGGTLKKHFPEAKAYDKYKEGFDSLEEVLLQDIIFICIWLTNNGLVKEDLDTLDEIIVKVPAGKVVVIKATVIPGTTDYFQEKYPDKLFIFNPEFLSEATAQYDFENPQAQILGCTNESLKVAHELMALLPWAPVQRIISPRDAEMFKHLRNAYLAAKVTIFNQFYDICGSLNVDYETLREIFIQDKWIGNSHTMIWHKGYRGFGIREVSKCLPKELDNLLELARMNGCELGLFKKVKELNEGYWEMSRMRKEAPSGEK